MAKKKRERLLLIDGTALAFRAFFAVPGLTDSQGRPSGALFGFLSSLLRILEDEPAEHLAVAWDRGEPTFRHKLNDQYKATRERMDEDLLMQLPWMQEALEMLGIPSLDRAGFEADDIIASLATQGEAAGLDVRLCAGDKDFAQVVSENITLCPPPKRGEPVPTMGPAEVEEKFGVGPPQMVDWQALVGDSSDNVKGIPGVGPKRATTLLQKYGDLDTVLERGPAEEKGKLRDNLEEHADTARQARELVRLKTDMELGSIEGLQRGDVALDAMREFCQVHSFNSLAERFEQEHEAPAAEADERDYRLVDTPKKLAELRKGLESSGGFAVDTETTSIDPLRARLVGMSFCWEEGTAWYVPMNLTPPLKGPKGEDPVEFLAPVLADESVPKQGQNIKYDAHVLERAGAPVRGWEFDTMLAHFLADPLSPHNLDALSLRYLGLRKIPTSALLGKGKNQMTMDQVPVAEVSQYACEDAEATYRLLAPLRAELAEADGEKLFRDVELPLVSVLRRMEAIGFKLDVPRLQKLDADLEKRETELENRVHQLAGEPFNLNSPKQLGPILFEKLKIQDEADVKRVRKTKTGYSTDAGTMDQYRGIEIVDALLEYRQLTKLRGTYLAALPGYVHPDTGCVHTSYHQAVASTGRLSSSDPNLQNIPIRTETGREIRRAFVPAHEGWKIVSADYSQIELRVVAHLAGDPALAQAFRDGADVHARTAALVFEVPQDQVTPEMRSRSKAINFGILYGMGPARLARELKIPFNQAREFIESYFEALPDVRRWLDTTLERATEEGEVRTLLGRRRPLPELQSSDGRIRAQAQNVAVNTPVQGSAADLIKVAMIQMDQRLTASKLEAQMLLQVHDELVFQCPADEVEPLSALACEVMEGVMELDVPLKVDVGSGPDWASAH